MSHVSDTGRKVPSFCRRKGKSVPHKNDKTVSGLLIKEKP